MADPNIDDALKDGEIRFVDNYVPSLAAGNYTIRVEQTLTGGSAHPVDRNFIEMQQFTVRGPRFSLDPSDIYAMFPPANSQGTFGNDLPHVVLTRRTLPWERNLFGDETLDKTPWMALLLFEASEILPPDDGSNAGTDTQTPTRTRTIAVADLLNPQDDTFCTYTQDSIDEIDRREMVQSCQVFDITPKTFKAVMPSREDARYLAHCREVSQASKDTAGQEQAAWYAVVVGGRFPSKLADGEAGKLHVAHLVSLEGFKEFLDGTRNDFSSDTKRVRLVSLASWTFTCLSEKGESFGTLMSGLTAEGEQGVEGEPGTAHEFRLPTRPLPPDADDDKVFAFHVLEAGYVPCSYQTRLGKQTFAWYRGPFTPQPVKRLPDERKPFVASAQAVIYDQEHGLFDLSYAVAWETGRLLALSDQRFGLALLNWSRKVSRVPQPDPEEELESIYDWLEHLYHLHGVPFINLVPNEQLLPSESIRFFYLDPNWLDIMLEGALSIGIQSSTDRSHRDHLYKAWRERIRNQPSGESGKIPVTGLLLRSAVVSGWPGLEMRAYATSDGVTHSEQQVTLLRMDRPAEDVLLCLFAQEAAWIEFNEPKEGLHFGIDDDWKIKPRQQNGDGVGGSTKPVDVECYQQTRRLNIDKLRTDMAALKKDGNVLGPADLALQLVKAPEQMVFQRAAEGGD